MDNKDPKCFCLLPGDENQPAQQVDEHTSPSAIQQTSTGKQHSKVIKVFMLKDPLYRINEAAKYENIKKILRERRANVDHLDFTLSTTYQHNTEYFPEKPDFVFQPQTIASAVAERKKGAGHPASRGDESDIVKKEVLPMKLFADHPLILGGLTEKIHPSSIKLMNSSHHSPQTNAGYVRQDRDGNVFQY